MSRSDGTVPLKCSSCGAALQIAPDVEGFSCSYCGGQQIVLRRGGTIALKLVGESVARVQRGTDRTAAELAVRRLKDDLLSLDSKFQESDYEFDRQLERLNNLDINPKTSIGCGPILMLTLGCFISWVLVINDYLETGMFALATAIIGPIILIVNNKSRRGRALHSALGSELERITNCQLSASNEYLEHRMRMETELNEHLSLLNERNS